MAAENTYSILLVDDDTFLIDMYSLKFSQAGHAVRSAQGTEEALAILKEEGYTPDAVVFDLVMPAMDGFELLAHMRDEKLAPGAALIVLSNQGEKEDLDKARDLGAVGHIVKANAIPSEVLRMVEKLVAEHKK